MKPEDLPPKLQLLESAFRLAYGTKAEQAEALATISLLVTVIQHEQHKETPCISQP